MRFVHATHFDDWRETARDLLAEEVPPAEVHWSGDHAQRSLFADEPSSTAPRHSSTRRVPPEFVSVAQFVAHHRDPKRWELLYRCCGVPGRGSTTFGFPRLPHLASPGSMASTQSFHTACCSFAAYSLPATYELPPLVPAAALCRCVLSACRSPASG